MEELALPSFVNEKLEPLLTGGFRIEICPTMSFKVRF
jgi:hypothetical protein